MSGWEARGSAQRLRRTPSTDQESLPVSSDQASCHPLATPARFGHGRSVSAERRPVPRCSPAPRLSQSAANGRDALSNGCGLDRVPESQRGADVPKGFLGSTRSGDKNVPIAKNPGTDPLIHRYRLDLLHLHFERAPFKEADLDDNPLVRSACCRGLYALRGVQRSSLCEPPGLLAEPP